ncbi:hypothetical protein P2H44_17755 [Albimonas sp. CAU 1670]|uniref:hypothetical protein n=1 Tax=Albimonas sp. CAU 1670 TaxID=3032599 RepID=UPI0023D9FA2F|nr:hypothetical protein [Albimonas sp. CAU 1670]MDF2234407.1 hypothetical protein [Albimonas sp. CAU 1670]
MFHAFVSRRGALRAALGGAGQVPPASFEIAPARPCAEAPSAAPAELAPAAAPGEARARLCGRRAARRSEPASTA